ncbi:hypothetical protein [Streptomyces sp. NPDC101132]|uniref:hypothetical protein n=1 Tax=Streptomyces sp. NPDC101132 TaxID=3366110 RepID=UPI0037FEF224
MATTAADRRAAGGEGDRRTMGLAEGRRVKLAVDICLGEAVAGTTGATAGLLSLAAGTEGTVERVDGPPRESHAVREYLRLRSLLQDYGHTMPEASRQRLEEEVRELEPQWSDFREHGGRATARVRFDNGFVLDGAPEAVLTHL